MVSDLCVRTLFLCPFLAAHAVENILINGENTLFYRALGNTLQVSLDTMRR